MTVRFIKLTLDENTFRKINNLKEKEGILDKEITWEKFLLKKCGIQVKGGKK